MARAYKDPTADKALAKIAKEDDKYKMAMDAIKIICKLAGLRIVGHITLIEDTKRKEHQ